MILPQVRDPRLITIRRGGTLTDEDHHHLALWAAACDEHVLPLFETAVPDDPRPRQAIAAVRAWVHGEMRMMQGRAAAQELVTSVRVGRGQVPVGVGEQVYARAGGCSPTPWLGVVDGRGACRSGQHVTQSGLVDSGTHDDQLVSE